MWIGGGSRMSAAFTISWLSKPDAKDYPAAQNYLALLYDDKVSARLVKRLKSATLRQCRALDLFRASALQIYGVSDPPVEAAREKIRGGQKMSPLLLVRDSVNGKLVIADGYHRLCAVYSFDPEAMVPCKIV